RLGRFWPTVERNDKQISDWQTRDVTKIEKCRDCSYNVLCGGGCGVVAANQNGLKIHSPNCRPVQEILDIGINYYADDIRAMAGDSETTAQAPAQTTAQTLAPVAQTVTQIVTQTANSVTVDKADLKQIGCLFCGTDLIYASSPQLVTCGICGGDFESTIVCPNGHFVCDACHSLDLLDQVETFLQASTDQDPVRLAQSIFEMPGLNMHGPEYHSIAPAILVAAWQNTTGHKNINQIHEAIRRGRVIPGGACGTYGACGAALGAGIAFSIIETVTALSGPTRGEANQITAAALTAIAAHGGPRCCKRETITTIQSFAASTDIFAGQTFAPYICHQCGRMKECIGTKCPFHPNHPAHQ
ncbi:MAG: DUF5714 domain-containing protein, partial [Eubacteriales bacterium]|nr:DUF5714 domain-containing protein [Eubacteriales bacterium]